MRAIRNNCHNNLRCTFLFLQKKKKKKMDIITILLVYTIFFGVGSAIIIVFARHKNSNLRKVWFITFYYYCFTYFFDLKYIYLII